MIIIDKVRNEVYGHNRLWKHPKIPTVASQLSVNTESLFAFMQDVGGF